MVKVIHTVIDPYTTEDLNKLYACNRISAMIWNKILELSLYYRKVTCGKWIPESDLKQVLKNVYPLHSQSVQAIIEKYVIAREDTRLAIQKGYKNKYPYKIKHHYPSIWKSNGFKIKDNILELSLGTFNHKRQSSIKIKLSTKILNELKDKKIQQIELIYKHQLLLSFMYRVEENISISKDYTNIVGIDLGEIHSITAYTHDNQACIISGRYLRSLRRLQAKSLGKLNKKLSKCTKGSKRYKKLVNAKRKMLIKTNNQIHDINHKLTDKFVRFAIRNKIKLVYIGNPSGIEKNTRKKKKKNKGRKVNQKLSSWSYSEHIRMLRYKLQLLGIKVELINESYTSQTCPCCGKRNKCNSRNYKCTCGYKFHRDVHGAKNILNKGMYHRIFTKGLINNINPNITYLQPIKLN